MKLRSWGLAFALASTFLVLGACGGQNERATPETVTVVETEETTVTEQVTTDAGIAPQDAGSASGGRIQVPDVVGMDHQLAQDTMQAAGLYMLDEEDATGQGRLLIWDRNWTVVSQDPPAGAMVSEDQTILLRSKKDDE